MRKLFKFWFDHIGGFAEDCSIFIDTAVLHEAIDIMLTSIISAFSSNLTVAELHIVKHSHQRPYIDSVSQ